MVSVIVPNYNYARFLKKRLISIFNQSQKPGEIVFLDDCSSDNSLDIAEPLLKKSGIPYTIIKNNKNSGSVFKQWQKGIDICKGEYIWIAEADDACSPLFIEKALAPIQGDKNVGLSYTESLRIDERNHITDRTFFRRIHAYIDREKWKNNYIEDGRSEVSKFLFIRNTIPNVSAVIFRSRAIKGIGPVPQQFVYSGDWLTYIKVLHNWSIAYISEGLNYNRFHRQRVSSSHSNTTMQFDEATEIAAYCMKEFDIPKTSKREFILNIIFWIKYSRERTKLDSDILNKLKSLFGSTLVEDALIQAINREHRKFSKSRNNIFLRLDRLTPEKIMTKVIKKKI